MLPSFAHLPACWRADELLRQPRLRPPVPEQAWSELLGHEPLSSAWRRRLDGFLDELEHGLGVLRLRAPSGLSEEQFERLFLRLTDGLGTPLSQDADGSTLMRVRDEGFAPGDPRYRGPSSRARLRYHCDRCDVIAFLCVRPAHRGGATCLVSSVLLYERLRREHPAALEVLCSPFPYLRHTIDPANPRPYSLLPVFSTREGRFAAHLLGVLIERADASPAAPDLRPEQREALALLDTLAEEEGTRFRLEPGELLLLENWVTFHRRDAFEDDPASPRLLLRRWLSVPGNRPLDPAFAPHLGSAEADTVRGGIRPRSGP